MSEGRGRLFGASGARAYLRQAAERLGSLEAAGAAARRDMTMIEVAQDEAREAAKLMQRAFGRARRARRASARSAPTGD